MSITTCDKCNYEFAIEFGWDCSEPYEFWCDRCGRHWQGGELINEGRLTTASTPTNGERRESQDDQA